ncbi:MAG: hypothetical protein ACE5H7_16260 [Acidiferrobacterales bacterium]
MWQINRSLSLIAFLAIALLILPSKSWAAELPEGIDVKVVAEWPVDIPGVEKMQLRRVEFQPGATIDLTIKYVEFCNGTQGEWAVTIPAGGTTTLHTAGGRWRMPAKGTKITVSNPGNTPAIQFVYRLIEKGT